MGLEEAIQLLKGYRETLMRDFSEPEELEACKAYTVAINSMEKEVQSKRLNN